MRCCTRHRAGRLVPGGCLAGLLLNFHIHTDMHYNHGQYLAITIKHCVAPDISMCILTEAVKIKNMKKYFSTLQAGLKPAAQAKIDCR